MLNLIIDEKLQKNIDLLLDLEENSSRTANWVLENLIRQGFNALKENNIHLSQFDLLNSKTIDFEFDFQDIELYEDIKKSTMLPLQGTDVENSLVKLARYGSRITKIKSGSLSFYESFEFYDIKNIFNEKFKFKELKIYSSTEWLADNKKRYRQVFVRLETTYIYAELAFYNKYFDVEDWEINLDLKCFSLTNKKGRKEICDLPLRKPISKYDNIIYVREGWGNKTEGLFWKKGVYCWEAWINGEKIATKYFYIEDTDQNLLGEVSPYLVPYSLRLYEGSGDDVHEFDRVYYKSFNGEETRYIYLEIVLKNLSQNAWECELFTKFYNSARELKGQVVRLRRVEKNHEFIKATTGWGSNVKGSWRKDRYTAELVFMDRLIATIPFEVGDDFVEGVNEYENIFEKKEAPNIKIIKIPDALKTAFQQYILFFREYVEVAKGKKILFDVSSVEEGLEIKTEIEDEVEIEKIKNYFEEYLDFARQNMVDVIEVEGDPSSESIDLLRMRLEQQIHNLNMEMKFKELQINKLEKDIIDTREEKLLLLNMIDKVFQDKPKPLKLLPGQAEEGINSALKQKCKFLIAEDKINDLFKEITDFHDSNSLHCFHDILVIKNQWKTLNDQIHKSQISAKGSQQQKNKIIDSLLYFIEQI